ncbi:MAG: hypothetical protein J5871_06480 [Bacteroidales bacterium]|nr:hypothetical protein [Bacteroidales bacterium]
MASVLHSRFIIDGVPQEFTPAGMLDTVLEKPLPPQPGGTVLDESLDPVLSPDTFDMGRLDACLAAVLSCRREFPLPFAASYTRLCLAEALIDTMWRQGPFSLDDLALTAKWTCNADGLGRMSALYASVKAAVDYLDGLGLQLRRCSCEAGDVDVRFATPFSGAPLLCPDTFVPDARSWIVLVPFDSCDFRLGGSLFSQAMQAGGDSAPQVGDADYLMDCFEVVREFVTDRVALAGRTVAGGGLLAAVRRMLPPGMGADLDLSDMLRSYEEKMPGRLLFGEVPGALLQIRDIDFDYADAEFLLQDVAYFPLGHPVPGQEGVRVHASKKSGIQKILESLMQNAEGED